MPPRIDVTGKTFGRLTVTGEAEKDRHGARRVVCTCICGTVGEYNLGNLKAGATQSCGCLKEEYNREARIDASPEGRRGMLGQTFGKLTIITQADGPGFRRWRAHCECGNAVEARGATFRLGRIADCGCVAAAAAVAASAGESYEERLNRVLGDPDGWGLQYDLDEAA